jgi:hypothetical protein
MSIFAESICHAEILIRWSGPSMALPVWHLASMIAVMQITSCRHQVSGQDG